MKNIKILFTITDLGRGGAERFLLDLIVEIEKNYPFIDYRIAVLDHCVEYLEFRTNKKVVFVDYKTFSFRDKKANFNLTYSILLDDFKPDIVHANRFLGEFITAQDVRAGIKYICHGHDNMLQFSRFEWKMLRDKKKLISFLEYRYLIKQKYNKVPTYFIANSLHTFSFYREVLPSGQKKNVVKIDLGFDYHKFYQAEIKPEKRKITLLNVGSYQPKKNQQFLIDVAEILQQKGLDFEMNLIGVGGEFNAIEEKIRRKDLSSFVFQRGLQTNVQDWFKEADIYVHSAYYEPFGLVFLEAMAAGLPIVTIDGKGNRDIILEGENGYIVFEQDAHLFAEKVIELAVDTEKRKWIALNGQRFAETFDVKHKVRELVDFYYSILEH